VRVQSQRDILLVRLTGPALKQHDEAVAVFFLGDACLDEAVVFKVYLRSGGTGNEPVGHASLLSAREPVLSDLRGLTMSDVPHKVNDPWSVEPPAISRAGQVLDA
jgi:hypothetical protein